MKRTVGKFVSLMLVLAMVLAMVPATLAAAGDTYSVEPGAAIQIETTTAGFAVTSWSSSDPTIATVAAVTGSTTKATVTGVKASSTAITITATGTLTTGGQSRDYSERFTVYVQDAYVLNLAISSGNLGSNTIALNVGDTRTLTATVTISNSGWNLKSNLEDCEVHFSSDSSSVISVTPTSQKVVKTTSGSSVTYKVEATVTAAGVGGATVTAQVYYKDKDGKMVPSESANATKTAGFRVSGGTSIKIALPTAQQSLALTAGGTSATLQPTVTGYTGNVKPKLLYLYDTTGNNLYVRPSTDTSSATVEPYKACPTTKIYICLASANEGLEYSDINQSNPSGAITGSYAICTVSIQNTGMTVTSLEVITDRTIQKYLDNGTKVFGLQDDNYNYGKSDANKATTELILGELTLTARIKAPDSLLASAADLANAYSRIEWSSKDPAIAKVKSTASTATAATAVIEAVATGTTTITAKVDGNVTATYSVTVYQGRAYAFDDDTDAPNIGETIGKTTDSELKALFEKETAKVEIQTSIYSDETATYYLPVKDVTVNSTDSSVTFTYRLNGLKKATKEFFYDRTDANGTKTYKTDAISFSDIAFTEQPVTAAYRITDTIADLAMTASVSSPKTIKSVVWYMNSDQTTAGVDRAIKTDTVKAGSTSHRSVLSNLKQYITGTGTYVFFCRVTASDNKYAETRKAIITITGENHVNIVFNPTTAKAGETFTITGTPQEYVNGKLTDVTGKSYTVSWTSSDENIVKLSSKTSTSSSPSITATAKAGGTVTIKAEATIGAKKYAAEKTFTVTVPTANDVSLVLGENDTYVTLDGSKISDAVKTAVNTAPSYLSFTQPTTGVIYTTSSMSTKITDGSKYSISDVSKMVFKPTTNAASYTLEYKAYGTDGQIASGKVLITTNAGTVEYHIETNGSVSMAESDFLAVLRNNSTSSAVLRSVTFNENSDNRGKLYKGSTVSSGTLTTGTACYTAAQASSSAQLLKNVTFIAGASTAKYSVTIPFTATATNGTTVNGNLVIYVNDTHAVTSVGATFRSMSIADEIKPDNASSNAYITIDSVVGGRLYTAYSSIISNTPLKNSDLGSTKFYFTSSSSGIDSLYVLPIAGKTVVQVNYTVYDGSTRTKGDLSFKVAEQKTSQKFSDVSAANGTSWATPSIDFMADSKLVNGVTTTTFGPNQSMTRAMLVTILYRAAGQPSVAGITNKFTDLKANEYYVDAVLWAANNGVVTGATATKFDPDGKITREQIAAILYRYAGSPTGTGASLTAFSDQKNVSAYAVPALQWAVGLGIITGDNTNGRTALKAKDNATRAQVAVMLHRFLTIDR